MRGGPEATWLKETAAQTYGVGDLVYVDSNGTVAICTVSTFNLNSAVLGIATKAATGVTGANAFVRLITPQDSFVMNIFHTTAASAVTAQTQYGQVYAVRKNDAVQPTGTGTGAAGSGKWVVDLVTTPEGTGVALARVKVVGFLLSPDMEILSGTGVYAQPALGDIYGPVIVRFVSSSIGTDGTQFIRVLQSTT